jgi:hypothetical protein
LPSQDRGSLLAECVAAPPAEQWRPFKPARNSVIDFEHLWRRRTCLVALGNKYIRPTINKNATDFYDLGVTEKLALAEKVHARQMTQAEAIFRWLKR